MIAKIKNAFVEHFFCKMMISSRLIHLEHLSHFFGLGINFQPFQTFSKSEKSPKSRIDFLPGKKMICFVVERVIMKPLAPDLN